MYPRALAVKSLGISAKILFLQHTKHITVHVFLTSTILYDRSPERTLC